MARPHSAAVRPYFVKFMAFGTQFKGAGTATFGSALVSVARKATTSAISSSVGWSWRISADLLGRPRAATAPRPGSATWGSGGPTDWRRHRDRLTIRRPRRGRDYGRWRKTWSPARTAWCRRTIGGRARSVLGCIRCSLGRARPFILTRTRYDNRYWRPPRARTAYRDVTASQPMRFVSFCRVGGVSGKRPIQCV